MSRTRVGHFWPRVKVEAYVEPRHVTIVEVRSLWDGVGDRTRFLIARLRYTATTRQWSIYWRDQNLQFHQYNGRRPTKNVQPLLDYIADSGDPIFWGGAFERGRMQAWTFAEH